MTKIAPSILSADFGDLAGEIGAVETAGADLIHIDVMDGKFVPNLTLGPPVIASIRKTTDLPFDVHLMIETPSRYIGEYADAGSDFITVHVEAERHLHRTVHSIKERGVKAGVSLNPATPLGQIEENIADLDPLLIDKEAPHVLLEVDGGVTLENIATISEAGADILVAGSSIFRSADYNHTIGKMKKILDD